MTANLGTFVKIPEIQGINESEFGIFASAAAAVVVGCYVST